jgi:hypothetical protein
MRVNEAGSHDEARGIDGLWPRDFLLGDGGNSAVLYADVSCFVERRFRVHDATVQDDQVIILGERHACRKQAENDRSQQRCGCSWNHNCTPSLRRWELSQAFKTAQAAYPRLLCVECSRFTLIHLPGHKLPIYDCGWLLLCVTSLLYICR